MWPDSTPPEQPVEAPTPKPERKVTVFDANNPAPPLDLPRLPGAQDRAGRRPLPVPRAIAPVRGIEPKLATQIERFLDARLEPVIPDSATLPEVVQAYRGAFEDVTHEFATLEGQLKAAEGAGSVEDKRAARLARARVRAALSVYARQVPAPAHLPAPQVITYGFKLDERAAMVLDEALQLLDDLVESDPGAAAEADALREELQPL